MSRMLTSPLSVQRVCFYVFGGKCHRQRSLSEGSKRLAKQSLCFNVTGGQEPEATCGWLGEGRLVGVHTWSHLIGALEKQLCDAIV
jgi:hypothetical protein